MAQAETGGFGELVRRCRRNLGLTQEELAERATVSVRAISDLERGLKYRPRKDTVQLLAQALELSGPAKTEFEAAGRSVRRTHEDPALDNEGDTAHNSLQPQGMGTTELADTTTVFAVQGSGLIAYSSKLIAQPPLPTGGFLGSLPSGPLVAREAELRRIESVVDAAVAGEGRTLLLTGEPGAGKTRLAQEATVQLRDRGFIIVVGRCYESDQAVPYFPFLSALSTLWGLAPPELRDEARQRWPQLGLLLPDEIGAWQARSGDDQQLRLFQAITSLLQGMSRLVPLALLLDDLHWADSGSLKLLVHLARETRGDPVLTLGTYRDEEVAGYPALRDVLLELDRSGLLERMPIQRLGRADTEELITVNLGETVPASLTELVFTQTEGNPFFVQHILRDLHERGVLTHQGGAWTHADADHAEVPQSIRSLIERRLARLPDRAQDILHEASVLGQVFSFDDLTEMDRLLASGRRPDSDPHGAVGEEVEDALDSAMRIGLVRDVDGDHCAFDHALTQQALYQNLGAWRRRKLHRFAGEALEGAPERKRRAPGSGRAAELARHFLLGDDATKALTYSLQAAEQARAVFAHGEAEIHARTALKLAVELGDGSLEAEAAGRLGRILVTIGRPSEALPVLDRARRIYLAMGQAPEMARAVASIARIRAGIGPSELAVREVQEALASVPPASRFQSPASQFQAADDASSRVTLYLALANLYIRTSQYIDGLGALDTALSLAEGTDVSRLSTIQYWRGNVLYLQGRITESRQAFDEALRLWEASGDSNDPSRLGHIVIFLGILDTFAGNRDRAHSYTMRGLHALEQVGSLNVSIMGRTLYQSGVSEP